MADGERTIRLPFPIKGLDRFTSYRDQPPLTSPNLMNVRAFDPIESRARGGQRPGIVGVYDTGEDAPIRMMARVSRVREADQYDGTDEDDFDWATDDRDDLGNSWETASWADQSLRIKYWVDSWRAYNHAKNTGALNIRQTLDLDATGTVPYHISIRMIPSSAAADDTISLLARMDDTAPCMEADNPLAQGVGLDCRIVPYGTGTSCALTLTDADSSYPGGAIQHDLGTHTATGVPTLMMLVDGNDVTVLLDGTVIATKTVFAHPGHRVGLGSFRHSDACVYLDDWMVHGVRQQGVSIPHETRLIVSAGGKLFAEADQATNLQTPGELHEVTVPAPLNSTEALMATELGGKLYIADFGQPVFTSSDAEISGASNNELKATGVADWAVYSINVNRHVAVIENDSRVGPQAGVYRITGVDPLDPTILLLDANLGAGGDCGVRIEKGPLEYDPASGNVALYMAGTGLGGIPCGCRIVTNYRGRVVFANQASGVQYWYMSRQGDPYDWAYGMGDEQAAVAGHLGKAGLLGDEIRALVPYSDKSMLFGCRQSLWVLTGDPAASGDLQAVSHEVGVLDRFAWCGSPEGAVYFMSDDGLHRIAVNVVQGYAGKPENVSALKIPRELCDVNPDDYEVSLAWDRRRFGVLIYLTPRGEGSTTHFFYDARTQGFFPETLPTDIGPVLVFDYNADVTRYRQLYLGGRDGKLRQYEAASLTDDGAVISSHVHFTPQALAPSDDGVGIVTFFQATLAADSDPLTWQIRVANRHEDITSAATFGQGVWNAGLNPPSLQRIRGAALALRVSNSVGYKRWALENVMMRSKPMGIVRV